MSMNIRQLSFAAAAAVGLVMAAAAGATQKAERIEIRADSERAVVIVKAPDIPISAPYQTGYRLTLHIYDPAAEAMRGGPYGGTATFDAKSNLFYDGYLVMDVKPGTYVITEFSRQDLWALCFHDNSLQFTVSAGQAVYLGELDAFSHVSELQQKAVASGRTSSRGGAVHFFDDVSPPRLRQPGAGDLAQVARMMQARMPKTTVTPQAATFAPARFGTGSDLFGMSRICGGYHAGSAKPKA
jgi:hypothetical protein